MSFDPGSLIGIAIILTPPLFVAVIAILAFRHAEQPRDTGWPLPLVSAVCAIGGATSALAWLTWEMGFSTYPNGSVEGPYGFWQLVGTASCATAVCVVGAVFAQRPWTGAMAAAAATALAYALAWALMMAPKDSTGLYGVGVLMIAVGGGLSLFAVACVIAGIRTWRQKRWTMDFLARR